MKIKSLPGTEKSMFSRCNKKKKFVTTVASNKESLSELSLAIVYLVKRIIIIRDS